MAGKLKPLDIPREEKPGKYADGDGLYLIVTSPTSKSLSGEIMLDCIVFSA